MKRKLLFILRHEEPQDDLRYIAGIAKHSTQDSVHIKVLLLHHCYLFKSFPAYSENPLDAQLNHQLKKILEYGAEVVYDKNREYPKWYDTYDPTKETDYALYIGQALRFKESGINRVDPYDFVANAVKDGFEVIKW